MAITTAPFTGRSGGIIVNDVLYHIIPGVGCYRAVLTSCAHVTTATSIIALISKLHRIK